MKLVNYLTIALLLLYGCSSSLPESANISSPVTPNNFELQQGDWLFKLDIKGHSLPFNTKVYLSDSGTIAMQIINNTETIEVSDISVINDSVFIRLPIFDSEFKGIIKDSNTITGLWYNYIKGNDYSIPFVATYGVSYRFNNKHKNDTTINGKWEVDFSYDCDDCAMKSIGEFTSDDNHLYGTFITESGDYRFLDGIISQNKVSLSCFDGSHAFLFNADIKGDSLVNGEFWSGVHWHENWRAHKNELFELRDPYSLTFLKDGYDSFEFSFPNLSGNKVNLNDDKFKDKVVIVQIMGSWCPNCYDETVLFSKLYDRYKDQGLEIVALCFEKNEDIKEAVETVNKLKKYVGSNYEFLIAANGKDSETDKALPMLNKIISFPTSVIIDRKGKIRKIHTGFYGPGTGDYYSIYTEQLNLLLTKLLSEQPN